MKKETIGIILCFIMMFITLICIFCGGGILLSLIFGVPTYIGVAIFGVGYILVGIVMYALIVADAPEGYDYK